MPQTADISTPKLVLVLIRASRSLAEFLEAGLAREGIHNPDFAILEALLHKGPLAMSAIEQKVHLAAAPLKVAIDRLRRRGMVSRQSGRDRSHAAWFELTEDGRQTITRIYARHTEDIEAVMRVLSPWLSRARDLAECREGEVPTAAQVGGWRRRTAASGGQHQDHASGCARATRRVPTRTSCVTQSGPHTTPCRMVPTGTQRRLESRIHLLLG